MRTTSLILSVLLLLVISSCATINFNATTIRNHSVMMNEADEAQREMVVDSVTMNEVVVKQYEVITDFEVRDKAGWIIGIIPVNKPAGDNHDYLGNLIQAEINKAGGDAAINIKMKAQNRVEDIFVNIITFGIYVPRTVTVSGQIIKYKNKR